jgi:hypothetical protein
MRDEQLKQGDGVSRGVPLQNLSAGAVPPPTFEQPAVIDRFLRWSEAQQRMEMAWAVSREGWNGKGMWIRLQRPDAGSKMTEPYFYIEYPKGHPAYPNGCRVPWFPSQTDLMASDWQQLAFK